MQIERIAISEIERSTYNPRIALRPGDAEYEEIKKSLEEFGLVQPLVWNKRSGRLVGGHQRLTIIEAQDSSGMVDVSVVDLDDAQEKLLNLALNNPGGRWDDDKLAQMVRELSSEPAWMASGFDMDEVNRMLRQDDIRHSTDFLSETLSAPGGNNGEEGGMPRRESVRSELFTMSFPLTQDDREIVINRLNEIKRAQNFPTVIEALVFLCRL